MNSFVAIVLGAHGLLLAVVVVRNVLSKFGITS